MMLSFFSTQQSSTESSESTTKTKGKDETPQTIGDLPANHQGKAAALQTSSTHEILHELINRSFLLEQLRKQVKDEQEAKKEVQTLYTTLAADYKDIEQRLHDLQAEYESHKVQSAQMKEKSERLFDENLNKILDQNERLKTEIAAANEQISEQHKSQINTITQQKDEWLKKYNDLCEIHQRNEEQLRQKQALWNKERDELQNKMNDINDKYDRLRQKEGLWNEERDELQNKDDERKGLVIKLREYETKQSRLTQDIERLTKEKEAATAKVVQLSHHYTRSNEELSTKCSTITDECELLRQKEVSWNKERDVLQNKMNGVHDERNELMIKLREYETKQGRLAKDIERLTKEKEAAAAKVGKLRETKSTANDRYNLLEAQYNETKVNMDAVNELNAKNEREIMRLQQEYERLTKEKEAATAKVVSLSHNSKTTMAKLERFKATITKYEAEKKELQRLYNQIVTEYNTLGENMTNKVNELQQKVDVANDVNQKHNELQQKYNKILNVNKSLEHKVKQLNDIKNKHQTEAKRLEEELKNMQQFAKELTQTKSSANDRYNVLQAQYYKTKENMDAVNELNAKNEREIKRLQQEYERLTEEKEAVTAKVVTLSDNYVRKNEKLRTKYSALSDECEELRQKETLWNKERDQLQNKMNGVNDKYHQLRQKEQISNKEHDELQNKNDECNGLMMKLREYETKQDQLTQDVERLTKEKEAATAKVVQLSHNSKATMAKLNEFQAKITKYEAEKKELQRLYDEVMTEYCTLGEKMVNKVNELQQKADVTNDVNQKYNELQQKYNKIMNVNKSLEHKVKQLNDIKNKHQTEAKRLEEELKNMQQSAKELSETKMSANDRYNALQAQYNETKANMDAVNELNAKNENEIKRLQQELNDAKQSESNKQTKLKQLSEDRASAVEKHEILQMEYDQMKEQNTKYKENTAELEQKIEAMDKERADNMDAVNIKLTQNALTLEMLEGIEQKLHQKHEELTNEFESNTINEFESQITEKYERLKKEFDAVQIERNEMNKKYQTLSNEYDILFYEHKLHKVEEEEAKKAANDQLNEAHEFIKELIEEMLEEKDKRLPSARGIVNKYDDITKKAGIQQDELQKRYQTLSNEYDILFYEQRLQKVEEEEANDRLKEYEAKAKVVLQKQKDELNEAHAFIKELIQEMLEDKNKQLPAAQTIANDEDSAIKYVD